MVSTGFQLHIAELSSPWVSLVVVTDGCVAVEAERNGILNIGSIWLDMSHFDSDASELAAQAAMAVAPK